MSIKYNSHKEPGKAVQKVLSHIKIGLYDRTYRDANLKIKEIKSYNRKSRSFLVQPKGVR